MGIPELHLSEISGERTLNLIEHMRMTPKSMRVCPHRPEPTRFWQFLESPILRNTKLVQMMMIP